MRVTGLQLRNFRNVRELSLDFSAGQNLFIGKNGQGKTNLLEAVYFLSYLKSNRTSKERELVRAGESFASVVLEVAGQRLDVAHRLEVQWSCPPGQNLKTVFKCDGSPVKSRSQLLGILPAVSFFVTDLLLLRGTPEDRRSWLDAAITQYDKRHFGWLSEFNKIRIQKSRLLKEPPERMNLDHLAVWNQQFAQAAARVIASRLEYLLHLADPAMVKYLELSSGHETLSLAYQPKDAGLAELLNAAQANHSLPDVQTLEMRLLQSLEGRLYEERQRGICLVGPHRDDMAFFLNQMDATAYGSQGQQRTIVLALKLAELMLLQNKLSEAPLLLLDDVMAELDEERQQLLLSHIQPDAQVLLTTTHVWPEFARNSTSTSRVYHVVEGQTRQQVADEISV